MPLNVARESLQNNPVVVKIRQTLVRRILSLLETMAKNSSEDYIIFWNSYGMVLKEGIARDFENKEQISQLIRFYSSFSSKLTDDAEEGENGSGLISLQDYVDRMGSDQEVIYYLTGENRDAVEQSPLLEAFRKRDLEVVYMTDPVDEWVVNSLQDFGGKKFQAVDAEDLELTEDVRLEGVEDNKERTIELASFLKKELENRVGDVKESQRLTDSPCVLVTPTGGMSQTMERMMQMQDEKFAPAKRVLEINPRHPAIVNLGEMLIKDRESEQLKEWAEFLVDYVLISEGTVEDPKRVVGTIQKMMSLATASEFKDDSA